MNPLRITLSACLVFLSAVLLAASFTPPSAGADPDLPAFMAEKIDKEDYLQRRAEWVNKRRGVERGRRFDPKARGRAIREMNRQEEKSGNTASTLGLGPTSLNSLASATAWTSIGPAPLPNGQTFNTNNVPVSGRTVAIAIHPTNGNIAYVGAAQGGVYRTVDGGATWTAIFDSAETLAIGAIAIAPSQPSTIYVGTGEGNFSGDSFFGLGVYRIDNADGANPILTGPLNTDANGNDVLSGWGIDKIIVHPSDPNTILFGTASGIGGIAGVPINDTTATSTKPRALWRSTNAASANPTFEKLTAATDNGGNLSVTDVEFEPGNSNTVLACIRGTNVAGGGGVYRSTNALAATPTFTRTLAVGSSSTLTRAEIAINKVGSQITVFAATADSSGTLKRSTDGGITWSAALSGATGFCGNQCDYDMPVAVDPNNGNILYLGGPGDSSPAHIMIKSTNALASTPTFSTVQTGLHADEHAIEIDPSNTNNIWTGNDGGIWKSTDAATTWTSLNKTGYSATQFQSLAVHPTDANFTIGGTQDNGTECQGPCGTFTGNTWNQADYGDGGFALIDQSATNLTNVNMYHTYYNQTNTLIGYAYVTTTANARFVSSPTSHSWSFNGTGGVASCTNGGGFLCSEAVEFYMPMAVGPGSPNPVYSGTDRLHRAATVGGTNTVVSQAPIVSGVPITAIGISPQSDSVRIVGLENGQVWRTMTGSSTLVNVTNAIPAKYVARAVIDPNNQNTAYVTLSGYFGNSTSHIYKTTNLDAAMPTWTGIDGGQVPDIPVNAFVIDPSNSNKLYAGTDIGVYCSLDGGVTWTAFSNSLPRVAVFDMAIQNSNRILRIATHGRGMWEIFIGAVGTLQGTVTNANTSNAINGATITVASDTTTTNGSGFYQFLNVPVGTYSVAASAPGYNSSAVPGVVVNENQTSTQNIALTPAPTSGCLTDTSQGDFQAGSANNVDTATSPGDVKLALVSGPEALDQQQTNTSGSGFNNAYMAQTFTAGSTGTLTKADLYVQGGGTLTIEIRTTSGGTPTTTVLGSTTISSPASVAYTSAINFSPAVNMVSGSVYALVISNNTGSGIWGICSSGGNNCSGDYAGGNAFTSTSGSSWSTTVKDFAFKTYVSSGSSYTTSGNLVSSLKDANPTANAVANWTTLSWTNTALPAGTTLQFQVAGSTSSAGPFNFVGPTGTASTFYTTSGGSLAQFNAFRYLKYKAYLATTNSANTPTLNDVTVCFSNTPSAAATSLAAASATGTYGGTTNVSATLTSSGNPVAGKTISFTLNGSSAGTATTNASGIASVSNASLAGINAGTYLSGVGASFAGDASYAASNGSNSLTVNPANQTITVNTHAPASAVYNSQFTVAATASSGLAVSYSSSGVCTNVGTTYTMTSGTGTCTVKYDQTGNSNYNAAPQVTESVTAAKTNQSINFTLQSSVAKSAGSLALTATASSGLTVSYASSDMAVATISGSTLNLVAAGSVTVTASQAGDSNYSAATPVDRTIVVTGPIAANDSVTRPPNSASIKIPTETLLGNDSRVASDGSIQTDGLAITAVTTGAGDSVQLSGGYVTFTPDAPSSNTTLTFTYTVSDGSSTAIGTVTVPTSTGPSMTLELIDFTTPIYSSGTNTTSTTVNFIGVPDRMYTIEYSTNLATWTIAGAPVDTTPTGSFAVPISASGDQTAVWNKAMFFQATVDGPF